MPDDSGHRILTYTAEAGSEAAAALAGLHRLPLTLALDVARLGEAI